MCPHSYFLILMSSEKNATAQSLRVDCFFFFFPQELFVAVERDRVKVYNYSRIYGWNPDLSLSLTVICAHALTHTVFFLRHQPVSQRVPMNPGGHMQSPSASWHTPPFRHSGQSLLQPGPHFLLGQPTGKNNFPNSKTVGIK